MPTQDVRVIVSLVCTQALATAMDDAERYGSGGKLLQVFNEVSYEIEITRAVAKHDSHTIIACLEEMNCHASESFFRDKSYCM